MNPLPDRHTPDAPASAQEQARARVAEITRLFARIRLVLDHSLRISEDLGEDTPRAVTTRIDQLIAAHLKVLAAEEAFHAAHATDTPDAAALERIRADLGRRLDRLRASLRTEAVPAEPE